MSFNKIVRGIKKAGKQTDGTYVFEFDTGARLDFATFGEVVDAINSPWSLTTSEDGFAFVWLIGEYCRIEGTGDPTAALNNRTMHVDPTGVTKVYFV